MLDCRAMDELRVRFGDGDQADLVLGSGQHALGRLPTGLGPVPVEGPWLLRLCNDRRGIWMTVAEGMRGIHVNGRPVQQVAMLRPGDSVHVDGAELLLLGAPSAPDAPILSAEASRELASHLRLVLRGVGGSHHGRSLNLDAPIRIGSAPDADIRIHGERIAPQHAVVELRDGRIVLRDAADDVLVNGHRTRGTRLRNGDQVAFGVQHRFVVEAPPVAASPAPGRSPFAADADLPPEVLRPHWTRRMPWLLITAVLLAGGLFALFVFGAR